MTGDRMTGETDETYPNRNEDYKVSHEIYVKQYSSRSQRRFLCAGSSPCRRSAVYFIGVRFACLNV